jgi:hypothetical protein
MGGGIFQIPESSCVEKPKKTAEMLIQGCCAKLKSFTCLVPAVPQVPPSNEKVVTKRWTVEESQLDSSQGQGIISLHVKEERQLYATINAY